MTGFGQLSASIVRIEAQHVCAIRRDTPRNCRSTKMSSYIYTPCDFRAINCGAECSPNLYVIKRRLIGVKNQETDRISRGLGYGYVAKRARKATLNEEC